MEGDEGYWIFLFEKVEKDKCIFGGKAESFKMNGHFRDIFVLQKNAFLFLHHPFISLGWHLAKLCNES